MHGMLLDVHNCLTELFGGEAFLLLASLVEILFVPPVSRIDQDAMFSLRLHSAATIPLEVLS
jgi:hypothetical protein